MTDFCLQFVISNSCVSLALALAACAVQARGRQIVDGQLQGGTFTVTNLGMYDVDFFTPIINLPQSSILGVGRIVREPAVVDDQIVARDRLSLSLTFDHRVLDGAPAAKWLQHLSRLIENADFV